MATTSIASAHIIASYLRHLRTRCCSPNTIRSARSVLNNLAIATGGRDLLTLTPAELGEWQARRAVLVAARTLRTQTSYVRRFYVWAVDERHLEVDPAARLVRPKVPRLLPRPIAEADLAEALDGADDLMRATLALGAFGGLRAAEIAGLDWSALGQAALRDRIAAAGYYAGTVAVISIFGWTATVQSWFSGSWSWELAGSAIAAAMHVSLVIAMLGARAKTLKGMSKKLRDLIHMEHADSSANRINSTLLGWSVAAATSSVLARGPMAGFVHFVGAALTGIWAWLANVIIGWIGG